MNAAEGAAKTEAMVELLTALVQNHRTMCGPMMANMMSMMDMMGKMGKMARLRRRPIRRNEASEFQRVMQRLPMCPQHREATTCGRPLTWCRRHMSHAATWRLRSPSGPRTSSRSRPRRLASQASGARTMRCSQRGGNAPCTSSSNSWVNRARSSGFGCRRASCGPARRGRPRSRRAAPSSVRAAPRRGRARHRRRHSRSRAARQGGRRPPRPARRRPLASHPEAHRALDDLEALLLLRVDVLAARDRRRPGSSRSIASSSPSVSADGLAERDPLTARRVLECLSCGATP